MTAAGPSPGRELPDPDTPPAPPPGFLAELAEAFRRRRPQGTARWNFSDAFTRLEQRFGATQPDALPPTATAASTGTAAGSPVAEPSHSLLHRLGDRYVAARLRPWIEEWAAAAAQAATEQALAEGLARIEEALAEGFDATVEAFRFLGARVEAMEDAALRRRDPVDAVAWLAPPPALGEWSGPVVEWVGGVHPAGEVLHGECGDGALVVALAEAGMAVRGAEPRGAVAWQAAERGVDVHVGPVAELLGSLPAGSLGGLVLSGVVDRAPLEELVALLDAATERLAAGAPLVIVGTRPEAVATGWDAVARDLLPGRPLHPETWELLLTRAGYVEVGRLGAGPAGGGGERGSGRDGTAADVGTYAVKGRRPS